MASEHGESDDDREPMQDDHDDEADLQSTTTASRSRSRSSWTVCSTVRCRRIMRRCWRATSRCTTRRPSGGRATRESARRAEDCEA
eukprot:2139433-Prymnesium_polylepis.1